jgi:hypothetical protein
MKRKILGLLAVGLLAGPMVVHAVPIRWTLNGSLSDFGRAITASGSFVYDADTGIFSDILLHTPTMLGPTHAETDYVTFAGESISFGLVFLQPGHDGGEGDVAFFLVGVLLSELTNAGGVLHVGNPEENAIAEGVCLGGGGTTCINTSISAVTNWDLDVSTLVGRPLSVPEPGTLGLLGLGLLGLGLTRRRAN